jgi:hypothetical protein
MKVLVSGAVALVVLVLIDGALFNGKYTNVGRAVLDKTASSIRR